MAKNKIERTKAKAEAKAKAKSSQDEVLLRNKKAHHDYEILKTYECGLVLQGSEVKSLREKNVQWADAHGEIERGEAWLLGLHVEVYKQASWSNHNPRSKRKLLLHRNEIDHIAGALATKGCTMVPLQIHLSNGRIKILMALAKGKAKGDKRRDLLTREKNRDIERAMGRRE